MTREEALKEYKAIRKRAQSERVGTVVPNESFNECLKERGFTLEAICALQDRTGRQHPVWLQCWEIIHNAGFDAFVKKHLVCKGITKPTPAQWVKAARVAPFPCGRCAGTGAFITYVENGIPKGPGGICFRCNGKGYQTDEDARRNYGHDLNFAG